MSKLFKQALLPGTVIFGITIVLATRAVAVEGLEQPTVNSTDSTAQSSQSPTERYGCMSGYGDRTFRGDRPVSRYEFAATLNACLNQMNQLINANTADLATQEDLAVPKRQLETLKSDLDRLRMRVDRLDGDNKQQ